jgi:hypothetical protein
VSAKKVERVEIEPGLFMVTAADAWREWLWRNASPSLLWDSVECIECELGRDCAVHGEET